MRFAFAIASPSAVVAAAVMFSASPARADDVFREAPLLKMAPGVTDCDAVRALETPLPHAACRRLSSRTVAGVGTARLYRIRDGGITRFALVIVGKDATGDVRVVTDPGFEVAAEHAMGGKEDLPLGVRVRLRAIEVVNRPAIALDVRARYAFIERDWRDSKIVSRTLYSSHGFIVCADDARGDLACVRAGFGDLDTPCHAHLADNGILSHTCTRKTVIDAFLPRR